MASSITPIPPTRADWIVCGACINGSIARRKDAMRRVSGFGAVTSTTRELPCLLRVPLRRVRRDHNGLGHVHVGDGRYADVWWLDDVDGLDADARTDMAHD